MKFKFLSLGQEFEYEGETYIKTSPLIASNVKTSINKMIPRYATLTLLDENIDNARKIKHRLIDLEEVTKSFNIFYQTCIETLEKNNALIPAIKDEIDIARDAFIKKLT